jgi:hypothetical protein
VSCNYDVKGAELRVHAEVVEPPTASLAFPCSVNETILNMINSSLRINYAPYEESGSLYELDIADLERLHRFQTRTVILMSTPLTRPAYEAEIIRLVGQVGSSIGDLTE